MCGRLVLGDSTWAEYHNALSVIPAVKTEPRYNIKPTNDISIVTKSGHSFARWWLIPHWHKGELKDWKATTFNARIEEAASKPSFRSSWRYGRCLIPATGYYEWSGEKGKKQPWFVTTDGNRPVFLMAGLMSEWGDIRTAAILTQAARPEITDIHPRMPVILSDDDAAEWIDGELGFDPKRTPISTLPMRAHKVAKFGLNDDGPELIQELIEPFL